jgi:hypothetical protein
MGVWEQSPEARRVAQTYPGWQDASQKALPGYSAQDAIGSPYGIRNYRVETILGGDKALTAPRECLQKLRLRLILDFVPNHMAIDHDWLTHQPQHMVQNGQCELAREPASYFEVGMDGHPPGVRPRSRSLF